jgi:Zn-dependent peptidase ImmA (M78 family)
MLRAWQTGHAQGRLHRDPWHAATAAEVPVKLLTQEQLQAVRRHLGLPLDECNVGAYVAYRDGSSEIFIDRNQDPDQLIMVLAHELGHHFTRADETAAEEFREGFCAGIRMRRPNLG